MGQKTKHILAGLTALLLVVSIGMNLVLYNLARRYYIDLNRTRLDPLDLSIYPKAKEDNSSTDQPVVVFFGDSRAHDWVYPEISGYHFINRGVGAQTSAQVVARFDQHVKPLDPDIIVLQVGINDLKTIPLFPGKKDLIVRQCEDNIRQIVTSSLDLGAVIVLTTIFQLGELPLERRLVWSDDVSKAIEEVNQYIVSLKGMDVIIFDSASVLGNKQGIVRQEYSRDFLHLNDTGYRALNEGLVNILEEIR